MVEDRREASVTPFYVYILSRPDGLPFYVGMGSKKRMLQHEVMARRSERSHRANIIRKIWAAGGEVGKTVVSWHADAPSAKAEEQRLIAKIGRLDLGAGPLVNRTAGGDGVTGVSDEYRLLQSIRTKIGMARPEVKEKARQHIQRQWKDPIFAQLSISTIRTYWSDPANRAAQSERIKRHLADPEIRKAIQLAQKIGRDKPEVREKMRLAKLGKLRAPRPREVIEKIAAANRGKKRGLESRERMRQAQLGKIESLETREKKSQAMKAVFAAKRQAMGARVVAERARDYVLVWK
jgi:hypothetical protein